MKKVGSISFGLGNAWLWVYESKDKDLFTKIIMLDDGVIFQPIHQTIQNGSPVNWKISNVSPELKGRILAACVLEDL